MANDKIVFFVDSSCDMPIGFAEREGIQVIGFRYTLNDKDGRYLGGKQEDFDDIYSQMRKGAVGRTSQISYDDAEAAFEPVFKDGADIMFIGLSRGLSGTYENIKKAGTDLAKKCGRKFYAPDTKSVSGQSFLIIKKTLEFYKKHKKQKNCFEHVRSELDKVYKRFKVYFTVDNLTYLYRGGRLNAAQALIGGMLKIKPIITVDKEGKLVNFTKKTGRQNSIRYLAELTRDHDPDFEIVIAHADSLEDAKTLQQKIKEIHPEVNTEMVNIGFIIGVHAGPGSLGLGFVAK